MALHRLNLPTSVDLRSQVYGIRSTFPRARVTLSRHARPSRYNVTCQANEILRVVTNVVKTAKDSLEFGSNFVPESVPRPVARTLVAVVGLLALSYVISSLVSVASFILGVGGLAYIAYIYFNKDDGSSSGGGDSGAGKGSQAERTDSTLEEARRIMEKYR